MIERFEACVRAGGVALFPADTVYGLATSPDSRDGVERVYALKGRPAERPSAVMWFDLGAALAALPWLGRRTRTALERLLPGPFTLLVANPERLYPLACGPDPERLGVRVPAGGPLAGAPVAVVQTSANPSGGPDARRLDEVDPAIRAGVDLEVDGGELPGTPSTVVDLTAYERDGSFAVVREGAVAAERVAALL